VFCCAGDFKGIRTSGPVFLGDLGWLRYQLILGNAAAIMATALMAILLRCFPGPETGPYGIHRDGARLNWRKQSGADHISLHRNSALAAILVTRPAAHTATRAFSPRGRVPDQLINLLL
jgi:hypothetical protein